MAEGGRRFHQARSTDHRERQQLKESFETQPQEQMHNQQRRRYSSAHCLRGQVWDHRTAQEELQKGSQYSHSSQLHRPYSSVRPSQQTHSRQKQEQQHWNSGTHSSATTASMCSNQFPLVLFDISRKERGDPSTTYKCLARQLQEQGMRYEVITEGSLTPEKLRHASLVVLAHPVQPFTSSEIEALRNFLRSGKSILAMLGEGGEREAKTNINYFLEEYGLTICSDSVVRTMTAGHAHLHPKETLISDGFLCGDVAGEVDSGEMEATPNTARSRESNGSGSRDGNVGQGHAICPRSSSSNTNSRVTSASRARCNVGDTRRVSSEADSQSYSGGSNDNVSQLVRHAEECTAPCVKLEELLVGPGSIPFVFPYGATVSVQPPAFPFLSSGLIAFPARRPLGAAFIDPSSDGRVVALGSYRMFDDTFLHKESNNRLQQLVFAWLLRRKPAHALKPRQRVDPISGKGGDTPQATVETDLVERSQAVPDTASMAERVMPCFQESEQRFSNDFRDLHEGKLYSVNLDMLPEVKKAYKQLNVKYEPLSIIKPKFEVPMPHLIPAVHPPVPVELSPPPLELFDLDEEVASPRTRLAYLTNRCTDNSLAYYVREAAHIVGYTGAEQDNKSEEDKENEDIAHKILWGVFLEIVKLKSQQAPTAPSPNMEKASDNMSISKLSAAHC